ncbi:MAG: UDP-N-acetylmuramoyl-L-alanyl-D-glutamate--2,6-diaminopimelate ligase [Ignavibacteria bacterium]|nr:UDP-N-acetylmuramoyl-L-alanyl-D-glutamate--2,6-diaminopimelate ligase [Ignavibacteria bacterium]
MYGQMVVTHDVEVMSVQYDSRKVGKGDCFVAIRGLDTDGHRFVPEAIAQGASVVVLEDDTAFPDAYFMHSGTLKVVVSDSRKALARMSANRFGHPSRELTMVGVTGTNGKTSTTWLIQSILEAATIKTGVIGTIDYKIGDHSYPAKFTTPESVELNELLVEMKVAGCRAVSMEVSSHALHQSRVHGISFDAAVFTNLTQDHLDYHKTMEEYFRAKKILFDDLESTSWAIINTDDAWGRTLFSTTSAQRLSYGFESTAAVRAIDAQFSIEQTNLTIRYEGNDHQISSPLAGRFNAYNILASYATGIALQVPREAIERGIRTLRSVRGRLERLSSPKGWTAFIDYAHTPDALEKCLSSIREIVPDATRRRMITVFGAGGDRDATKRPQMGKIASERSDIVVVTSDNPRTENPDAIIDAIVEGIPDRTKVVRIVNRREAIIHALTIAQPGDVVLIAGKGHEEYQIIGKEKKPFSDRSVVESFV